MAAGPRRRQRPGGSQHRPLGLRAAFLVLLLGIAIVPVRAQEPVSAGIRAFDRFITSSAPLCLYEPAAACVDAAWLMADRDRDRQLSLEEITTVQQDLTEWARWKKPELHEKDWSAIQLGLLVARAVGLNGLFESLDADRDRGLSQTELLADVTLDRRPLPQILTDRSAVDWDSVSRRLGSFAGLVDSATKAE